MIKFLQKGGKTQKYFLGGLLLFLAVAMCAYLIPGFTDTTGINKRGVVARVGDEEISSTDVAEMARRMGQQQFGGQVPDQFMPMLYPGAAQSLITQKAVELEAQRIGLRVSDEELAGYLR